MEKAYDRGYREGVSLWVNEIKDLPPKDRNFRSMCALINAAKSFMDNGVSDVSDYACGFSQAMVDKENKLRDNIGKASTSFCVSRYAFALSDMAKTFLER